MIGECRKWMLVAWAPRERIPLAHRISTPSSISTATEPAPA